jgi:hypothetical protein
VSQIDEYKKYVYEQINEQSEKVADDDLLCDMCDEQSTIVSKCYNCNWNLCETCDKGHTKIYPEHHTILIMDIVLKIKCKVKETEEKCQDLIASTEVALNNLTIKTAQINQQLTDALDLIEAHCLETLTSVQKYHDDLKKELNDQVLDFNKFLNDSNRSLSKQNETLQKASSSLGEILTTTNINAIIKHGENVLQNVFKGRLLMYENKL